ncbi:MAG: helix-turn-helix transcriptional regulator [Rubrobacter sp.]|nr:helix-turn-helix transcriptional regulator [Rubrobacter sp.]
MSESEGKPKSESLAPQDREGLATPSSWLEPAVLVTLLESNLYGYKLMEQLAMFGFEATNPGTLYRALRRMEHNGVLESQWETTGGGPARRVYSLTQAGEAYLDLWANALKQYQQVMNMFFQLYTSGQWRARGKEQG